MVILTQRQVSVETLEKEQAEVIASVPPDFPRGVKLLHDPVRNKGTAFTEAERIALNLRGLLPPRVHTQEQQVRRVMEQLAAKSSDLSRYIYLVSLQDRNETLFYRVITNHLRELMPIVYTPTVGLACEKFGHIFRRPRGIYISGNDRGHMDAILNNWPHEDVRIIVVTDGERILGLGDLGAAGMGIPIGKLILYTACAGIHPTKALPVTLDVGTNNESLQRDPLYIGLRQKRLTGAAFDEIVEEFITTVHRRFPHAVVQLEDFANHNAFRLLDRYRNDYCLFDDDIQGTGSVTLAGLLAATRLIEKPLTDHRFLFLGAGEAGIGIADLICAALKEKGLSDEEARARCWFFDSKGLVVKSRTNLADHKVPYAHAHELIDNFETAVRTLKPSALIGVSGTPRTFGENILRLMTEINQRPIVFALSNPTSKSECTARQAYEWTQGRAVFASGSPFDSVDIHGQVFVPGQANNAYIFPGVGLGAIASETRIITDEMFFVAAKALANEVSPRDLAMGRVYPSLTRIRDVSAKIATAVASLAYDAGLAGKARPTDVETDIRGHMFEPKYQRYA
ncbi:MAG: NAD-dependent malic enzyme [Rhodothermales bacterium]|nr:NAD-dependent malic enzyme [Rhodothermales bacterium]